MTARKSERRFVRTASGTFRSSCGLTFAEGIVSRAGMLAPDAGRDAREQCGSRAERDVSFGNAQRFSFKAPRAASRSAAGNRMAREYEGERESEPRVHFLSPFQF